MHRTVMANNDSGKEKRNHVIFATDSSLMVEETLSKDPFSALRPADSWQEIATNLAGA